MNLNNICRICMEKSYKLTPIFDPIKPPHFSVLIMACAAVQVQENDGLPSFICQKCISRLNIAFQFKSQCESSDIKLRQYIQQQKLSNSSPNKLLPKDSCSMENKQTQIEQSEFLGERNEDRIFCEEPEGKFNIIDIEEFSMDKIKQEQELNEKNRKNTKLSKCKIHQCSTCGKVFKSKPSLVHHIRIHTGERPYLCHICQKRFMNGGHLHTHMKTHTGEKNHICAACNKAFATSQQLTKHTIAIHTSERPYGCTYCAKRFASSSNLNTHIKVHTGEKNYHCEVCGKTFSTKGQLQQHLLVHTGEKAFLCEFCNKKFSQKAHLLRHFKIHNRTE